MRPAVTAMAIGTLSAVLNACSDPGPRRPVLESVTVHSGNQQAAEVRQALAQPLAVIARSTTGEPMEGVELLWNVVGGGSVTPTRGTTGPDGIAQATRFMGATVGEYTTVAVPLEPMSSGQEAPVFSSHALLDGGYLLGNRTIGPLTDTTLGTNDQPLVVMVTDHRGEPVPGVVITWQTLDGGTLSETSVPTDAGGESIVSFTYGLAAGTYRVEAVKAGLPGSPLPFVLTATAGNAVGIVKTSGDNLSVAAGAQVVYTVTAQDARGNAANGVRITWAVASGDGSISPAENFTGGNGTAMATRTLGANAGAQTATATAPDLPGAPTVTFTTTASQ